MSYSSASTIASRKPDLKKMQVWKWIVPGAMALIALCLEIMSQQSEDFHDASLLAIVFSILSVSSFLVYRQSMRPMTLRFRMGDRQALTKKLTFTLGHIGLRLTGSTDAGVDFSPKFILQAWLMGTNLVRVDFLPDGSVLASGPSKYLKQIGKQLRLRCGVQTEAYEIAGLPDDRPYCLIDTKKSSTDNEIDLIRVPQQLGVRWLMFAPLVAYILLLTAVSSLGHAKEIDLAHHVINLLLCSAGLGYVFVMMSPRSIWIVFRDRFEFEQAIAKAAGQDGLRLASADKDGLSFDRKITLGSKAARSILLLDFVDHHLAAVSSSKSIMTKLEKRLRLR